MALGKIKADTLEHSTAGSLDTSYVVQGSLKMWVNFNGTGTIAVRDSLNVASLNDRGAGDYDANYTANGADLAHGMFPVNQSITLQTDKLPIGCRVTVGSGTAYEDDARVLGQVSGDLA